MANKNSFKFIALSGTTGVTENLYIYEYGDDMIVVDCGVGFPETEMLGVDLVIPDFTYIVENARKLRAIFITHGHEDHLGALPFLLQKVKAPIYSTKLVAGFIEDKLEDYKMKGIKVNVFSPENDVMSAGVFKVTPFRISHSVPDSVGFMIDTPDGKVFHVADYKFDWTPVDGKPFDIRKLATLASGERPLLMASDSLGANTAGYTESERQLEERIENVARDVPGAIFFTTISSNISRMQQAINVAQRFNRKFVFVGRSVERKADIARKIGFLNYPSKQLVSLKQARHMKASELMYIISGSYGQPGSALYRATLGEHSQLSIEKGDLVIFSSDPAPPGSKANVDNLVDRILEMDADVHYYDMQEDLHVSGHGSMKDIEMLAGIVNPKYFAPIGGTIRHMRAFSGLISKMGWDSSAVFELKPGEVVEFENGNGKVVDRIPVKEVLVDGLGVGDVGSTILRDRHVLSQHGIAIVLVELDGKTGKLIETPEIISRGFVFGEKRKDLFDNAARELAKKIEKRDDREPHLVKNFTIDYLERLFFEKTGRRPMVLPLIVVV